MNIPMPPTHADLEADRQARAAEVVTITDAGRAALAAAKVADALATLKAAGWRELEMIVLLDGRRQWRTVLIAPEGVRT